MLSLGGMEIVVILVVALLVLGPDKLPNFMRTVGRAMGELRRASTEFQRTIHTEVARGEALLAKTVAAPEEDDPSARQQAVVPEKRAHRRSLPRASSRRMKRTPSPNTDEAGCA